MGAYLRTCRELDKKIEITLKSLHKIKTLELGEGGLHEDWKQSRLALLSVPSIQFLCKVEKIWIIRRDLLSH